MFPCDETRIKAVGVAVAAARTADRPEEFGKAGEAWATEGWLVQVEYYELVDPIKPKEYMDILAPLLPPKYSPIRSDGGGNQVYLAEIPSAMANALLTLIGSQVDMSVEASQEHEIQNRTDIGATEKYQLVRSRVGQGQYRKNLENHEFGCRITGVTDGRFLRASHVKPWSKSSDFEKLDGNNGLLLAPHIDHLFDRGFISFENNGDLMLSSKLPSEVTTAWKLMDGKPTKDLSVEQRIYMDYHRREIFKGSSSIRL